MADLGNDPLRVRGDLGGGSGHQVTVSNQAWDEITVAVVEVKNGGTVEDYKWNEDLTDPATSLSVTTTGPAVLVAFWFGDGGVGSAHAATPNNGFSIVESLTLDSSIVQATVATRFVPGAGTYNVEWDSASGEGAQLYLVAVRTPGSVGTPALSLLAPNGGESWPLGSKQQVRWTAQAIGTSSTVRVSLVNGASTTVLGHGAVDPGVTRLDGLGLDHDGRAGAGRVRGLRLRGAGRERRDVLDRGGGAATAGAEDFNGGRPARPAVAPPGDGRPLRLAHERHGARLGAAT